MMKILIVDDDPIIRRLLQAALTHAGHQVVQTTDGASAWELLQREPIQVVITDWMMPDMDGPELIRRIRASDAATYTYVILLTTRNDTADVVLGLDTGADDYLTKPFHPDELRARVRIGQRILDLETRLQGQLALTGALTSSVAEGLYALDPEGCVTFMNPAAEQLLGWTAQELRGAPMHEAIHFQRADGNPLPAPECPLLAVSQAGVTLHADDDVFTRRDGAMFPVEYTAAPILLHGQVAGTVLTFHDVTERKQAERDLAQLAHYDRLTGLPNRTLFTRRLLQELESAHRQEQLLALLFLDLDGFKAVNDTFGHSIGDLLLQVVAERLTQCVREGDTIARLAGDEFTVVLKDIRGAANAARVAQKMITALGHPCTLGTHVVTVGASIGIALYPDHALELETLLASADAAMYAAKTAGKNRYALAPRPSAVPANAI